MNIAFTRPLSHLQSLRLGHATNSSSSHSVVVMNPGVPLPRTKRNGCDFGWDHFILADAESKRDYLTLQAQGGSNSRGDYIDHDSVGLTSDFPEGFIMHDRVVILGGNDNSERFRLPGSTEVARGDGYSGGKMKVRRDGAAEIYYWTGTGTKVRLSPEPYLKSTYPELVDVKLTDYCPYGCFFCYQGSTRAGRHASLEMVARTVAELRAMEVFEVALGGGEPVLHPHFPEIVQMFTAAGIKVNLTVFGVEWLTRPEIVAAMKTVGGLGVSYHTPADEAKLDKIIDGLRAAKIYNTQVVPQHVVGTHPLAEILESVHGKFSPQPLLLLGYKNVGRGADVAPQYPVSPVEMAVLLGKHLPQPNDEDCYGGIRLSVDTSFLDQYGEVLRTLDVPDYLTSSPEGKFSMYLDLVAGEMAPSSYCDPGQRVPLDFGRLPEVYAAW